jgi:hypothetical protein
MGCDDSFGWWFRLVLNVTSGVLFGWAYLMLLSARRSRAEMREAAERATRILRYVQALPGDDDDPSDASPLH